jgi:ornithine carbamoyltransferase
MILKPSDGYTREALWKRLQSIMVIPVSDVAREKGEKLVKQIALIIEKASTRTRCAFETAAYDHGAHVTCLGPTAPNWAQKSL